MKIAITADLHLTTQDQHPERFQALSDILKQCESNGVEILIIAGDLFDKNISNFSDFESVYQKHSPDTLSTYIIPGNHDRKLEDSAITLKNVKVINGTSLINLDSELDFLFVPYLGEVTMGEEIVKQRDQLKPDHWVLIGHGDWGGGVRPPDPYEKGVYMPLASSDIITYKPCKAFLGHIHLPSDSGIVHYVGSPCPLKISETGRRRFIVFDTGSRAVTINFIDGPKIYFIEHFIVLPLEDEVSYLRELIRQRIQNWNLPEEFGQEVFVRVYIAGYTSNRSRIAEVVKDEFKQFCFYDENGPLLNELEQNNDPDRACLAQEVKKWIDEQDWDGQHPEPNKDDILVEALRVIYGA